MQISLDQYFFNHNVLLACDVTKGTKGCLSKFNDITDNDNTARCLFHPLRQTHGHLVIAPSRYVEGTTKHLFFWEAGTTGLNVLFSGLCRL